MSKPVSPEATAAAHDVIARVGAAELARIVGVTRFAVHQWRASGIPPARVGTVSAALGIPPHRLRPDLFSAPQEAA
jgi:DNA-binding transcriptional regulator YdaS (Cro superfamily)